MKQKILIGEREVGPAAPCFVIAEAGVNHNGDAGRAKELALAAKSAGADCVKFQTFRATQVASQNAPKASYQLQTTDPQESQVEMLRKLELPETAYGDLIETCNDIGILFASTPYNKADIDFLAEVGAPFFKAASMHCAEPLFLQRMAEVGLPIVLSTGMATLAEIREAVDAIRATGNDQIVLLQCHTDYPSAVDTCNLRAMAQMGELFDCLIGYSDHTQSQVPCIVATALGATVIEKHLTLDQGSEGPDHSTSESPESFAQMVHQIREVEIALGSAFKQPSARELENITGMRRSLTLARDIAAGEVLQESDLEPRRPLGGLPAAEARNVIGRVVKHQMQAGAFLTYLDLESPSDEGGQS